MKYELFEATGKHPWRVRKDFNGKLVPAYMALRGIRDVKTREVHTEPRRLHASQVTEVRALNGMPPLTMQKVRGVLRKANISASETHTTCVRGWHNVTSGTTVWQDIHGAIHVGYNVSHWAKDPDFPKLLAPAFAALQAAGLNPTQADDGMITL